MKVEEIKMKAAPVLARHGATEAYLFGSAARGEATPESDIDILVRFKELVGLFGFVRTKLELQDALEGLTVDLVQIDALREEMKPSVNRDKVRII